MNAQQWKKPEFGQQLELQKLNDRLHDLRLEAGLPSARAIRNSVGGDVQGYWIVNHQAVLDIFQKGDLPKWERLQLIVEALAEKARLADVAGEVDHFKSLWKGAFRETVAQASVDPQDGIENPEDDDDVGSADSSGDHVRNADKKGAEDRSEEGSQEKRSGGGREDSHFNYAHESLKGLVINASQALWNDKDALRVFLEVVRRSEGFHRMVDALEEGARPANATFLGVRSREFEVEYSPAKLELVTFHRFLEEHRVKRKWSFTDVEEQSGVSSDAWIRWCTNTELPDRGAVVAFSHTAMLRLEDHALLVGLWEAARDALAAQTGLDALPSNISFDEAWKIRGSSTSRLWALAGVGDGGSAYGPDLSSGSAPAFIVSGPAGSGRSTALVSIARSLIASGSQVILIAPKPSPLRELSGRAGVASCFVGLVGDFARESFEKSLAEASAAGPVVIVMDDAELVNEWDARRLLEGLLKHGFDDDMALVLGGDEGEIGHKFRWVIRKSHRGLILSPKKWNAGDLIGVRTGDSITQSSVVPGRGWLHLGDGRLIAVAVPR